MEEEESFHLPLLLPMSKGGGCREGEGEVVGEHHQSLAEGPRRNLTGERG